MLNMSPVGLAGVVRKVESRPRARDFGGEPLDRAGDHRTDRSSGRRAAQRNGARVLAEGGRADERVIAPSQEREAHCVDELRRRRRRIRPPTLVAPTFRRGVSHSIGSADPGTRRSGTRAIARETISAGPNALRQTLKS